MATKSTEYGNLSPWHAYRGSLTPATPTMSLNVGTGAVAFAALLGHGTEDEAGYKSLRESETTGRPLGSEEWLKNLEKKTGRALKPQKRGPKTKKHDDK